MTQAKNFCGLVQQLNFYVNHTPTNWLHESLEYIEPIRGQFLGAVSIFEPFEDKEKIFDSSRFQITCPQNTSSLKTITNPNNPNVGSISNNDFRTYFEIKNMLSRNF